MKKIYSFILLLSLSILILAQSPHGFNYQAIYRDVSGNIIPNDNVTVIISILQGAVDGTEVFSETHTGTTNDFGLINLVIGSVNTIDFPAIDWSNGPYYLKVNINETAMGATQLLSVPYALHAKTAETAIYTTSEIAALSPSAGDAVFNSTENLYQVYVNGVWQSFNANCWPQPTTANAGADQTFTDGTVMATLAANSPEAGHGTGAWTIINGTGGSFYDASSPTSTFTGQLYESYELQWSITTSCDVSSDNVNVFFGEPITDIAGNIYQIVKIDNQIWMAENLKTTKYNDGTDIPLVTDGTEWGNLTTPGYCWYNNDQATYGDTYGALYNWYTVETGNLCPAGWHVPTDAEWTQLTDYLGGESVAGGKLKEAGTTHWNSPNEGATNETGFTALPGGYRRDNGSFENIGNIGFWWSATESTTNTAWTRGMPYNLSNVYRDSNYSKAFGFSVRCLRD